MNFIELNKHFFPILQDFHFIQEYLIIIEGSEYVNVHSKTFLDWYLLNLFDWQEFLHNFHWHYSLLLILDSSLNDRYWLHRLNRWTRWRNDNRKRRDDCGTLMNGRRSDEVMNKWGKESIWPCSINWSYSRETDSCGGING